MLERTVSLGSMTPEQIRSSNIIEAIDLDGKYLHKVHGFNFTARAKVSEVNDPPQTQKLRVVIDDKNPDHWISLTNGIESIKGRLAPEVTALREKAMKEKMS